MKVNYDDIDFLINTLYNYIYGKEKGTVELKRLVKSELQLSQIKMPLTFDKDAKKKVINNLKFTREDDSKVHFKRISDSSYPSTVTFQIYSKDNTNVNSMQRSEVVDMIMKLFFSELVLTQETSHILLPILNFDIEYSELPDMVKDKLKGEQKDIVCVKVTEHFFSINTLGYYLENNNFDEEKFTVLFFQIFYTLYKIQRIHPEFRHNKLDLNSIYLYRKKDTGKKKTFYVKDIEFSIPDSGFEIKIGNFENSSIDNLVNNHDAKSQSENPYYDIHYFLHSLLFYFITKDGIPEYLKNFFDQTIPDEFRSNDEKNFNGLDEAMFNTKVVNILTPQIILTKNNFFTKFIKQTMDMSASSTENSYNNIESSNTPTQSIVSGGAKMHSVNTKSKKSKVYTRRIY